MSIGPIFRIHRYIIKDNETVMPHRVSNTEDRISPSKSEWCSNKSACIIEGMKLSTIRTKSVFVLGVNILFASDNYILFRFVIK